MFKNIIDFFDNNQLLGVIIILFLIIVILWYIMNNHLCECSNNNEHLTMTNTSQISHSLPQCTSSVDIKFNASFVGPNKLVNFKTVIDGKEYYLANVKLSECDTKQPEDCSGVAMVLIEKSDIDEMMKSYVKQMDIAKETCNADIKIKCTHNLPSSASEEDIQNCGKPHISCDQKRKFYHDFNVFDMSDPTKASQTRKYIIKGTAVPNINDVSYPTMMNQSLYDNKNVNLLCGDTFNYGQPNLSKDHADVIIIERDVLNDGGIIRGTGNDIRVKFRFNTRDQLITHDKNGKKILSPIMDPNDPMGGVKKIGTYVGVCPQTTCVSNGRTYKRVCLYPDIINPNVLEFEPILVELH